jgi:8-oxo-dGTP pyrophosphatase MutT (NUDIX family)
MNYIDKVAWIYIRDKKVLSTISKGKTVYYLPGGKREAGESDIECLTREIEEELSITLIKETITYFGSFEAHAHGHPENIKVRMLCYFGDYLGSIKPSSEIEKSSWLEYKDKLQCSLVDQIIFDVLKHDKMIL